jgi:hypothetical protein
MNIRKVVRKILFESIKDPHYIERLYDRFLRNEPLVVGYEIPGSRGEYEDVGTYVLPENTRAQIIENAKVVENANFPKGKSYGIQLTSIIIDKSKVNYYSDDLRAASQKPTLIFVDRKTESNGNLVYAIIRENTLKTIYFAKSYILQSPEKLRVDAIIKNIDVVKSGKVR